MKEILDIILIKEVVRPVIIILISILFYIVLSKVIKNIFRIKSKKINSKKQETLKNFFVNILRYVIIVIAILMILDVYGFDTKALIASLGVAGLIIGLALQDMIKDFVSGVSIVLDDTYNVGDWVTINNFKGEVILVGMKATRVKSYSGDTLIINNGSIKDVINHSVQNTMAIVDVNVAYETNLDKCEKILTNFCSMVTPKIETLKGEISLLGIEKLGDSSIVFRIAAEVENGSQFDVQRQLRKLIKEELDRNKIKIPFPQVVVHNE